jgi:hypothetical protein
MKSIRVVLDPAHSMVDYVIQELRVRNYVQREQSTNWFSALCPEIIQLSRSRIATTHFNPLACEDAFHPNLCA